VGLDYIFTACAVPRVLSLSRLSPLVEAVASVWPEQAFTDIASVQACQIDLIERVP